MRIGKWYDPISERWYALQKPASMSIPQSRERRVEHQGNEANHVESQRIWELLVDCCARG
jgi:hypothetical protein